MYLYICLCVLCIVICMHNFHSAHIFKVCNSVIWPTHSIFNHGHIVKLLLNYTAILCTVHWTRMLIYIGYWTLNIYYYYQIISSIIWTYIQLLFFQSSVQSPLTWKWMSFINDFVYLKISIKTTIIIGSFLDSLIFYCYYYLFEQSY